jgi:hypothetical protein
MGKIRFLFFFAPELYAVRAAVITPSRQPPLYRQKRIVVMNRYDLFFLHYQFVPIKK